MLIVGIFRNRRTTTYVVGGWNGTFYENAYISSQKGSLDVQNIGYAVAWDARLNSNVPLLFMMGVTGASITGKDVGYLFVSGLNPNTGKLSEYYTS